MHERRLHVHAENHAEPDEIDAEPFRRRPEQGDHDEGDLEEVEKEGEEENEHVDEDEESDHAARQRDQQFLDPSVAIDAIEREREHARADQDEDHESRELGGDLGRLTRQIPRQPPLDQRQDQRAGGAHGPAFGRGSEPDEDGAEHKEDQEQRWHHYERDLLGKPRQEPMPEQSVAKPVHHGDAEGEDDTDEHQDHDVIGPAGRRSAHREHRHDAAGDKQGGQRDETAAAVVLAVLDRLDRQTGRQLGEQQGDQHYIAGIEARRA